MVSLLIVFAAALAAILTASIYTVVCNLRMQHQTMRARIDERGGFASWPQR